MKYIVKNCPALRWDRLRFKKCYENGSTINCCDRTNCLLKQILKLSDSDSGYQCDNCNGVGYYEGCTDENCSFYRLMKIQKLFEIEEINNEIHN